MGRGWFSDDMWARYIIKAIVPYFAGAPATFIVDSSPVHLTDISVDTAREHEVCCVQVPPRMTTILQAERCQSVWPFVLCCAQHVGEAGERGARVFDSLALAIQRYCAPGDR